MSLLRHQWPSPLHYTASYKSPHRHRGYLSSSLHRLLQVSAPPSWLPPLPSPPPPLPSPLPLPQPNIWIWGNAGLGLPWLHTVTRDPNDGLLHLTCGTSSDGLLHLMCGTSPSMTLATPTATRVGGSGSTMLSPPSPALVGRSSSRSRAVAGFLHTPPPDTPPSAWAGRGGPGVERGSPPPVPLLPSATDLAFVASAPPPA